MRARDINRLDIHVSYEPSLKVWQASYCGEIVEGNTAEEAIEILINWFEYMAEQDYEHERHL